SPFFTAHLSGLVYYLVAFRRGCDNDSICTNTICLFLNKFYRICSGSRINSYNSFCLGKINFLLVEIQAYYFATIGLKQLTCYQTDQSKTGNNNSFSKSGINKPYSLKTDGSNNRKSGFFVVDVIRDLGN